MNRLAFARRSRSACAIGGALLVSLILIGTEAFAAKPAVRGRPKAAVSSAAMPRAEAQLDAAAPLFGKPVGQITLDGLKRLEKDAVLAKVGTKPGQVLLRETVKSDIQSLYGMGYFDEVEVTGELTGQGTVNLKYRMRERPVISRIDFDGNERISTSDLKDVIKVKEWGILDVAKVREDVSLIQKHYEDKGFYLAKVSFELKTISPEEVEVVYKINDYEKVQIKKITFLNNKRYSDETLKGLLAETREGGFFSFVSGSGSFKESAFKQDLQRLTYWYLEHGYVKFRYENPVVTVSDDKKWLYISIYVDEGEQFKMGTMDFGGDLLFPKDELHTELSLLSEEPFSISKRNADIQKLTEKYQDLGYAFVNVVPKMNIHDDTRSVDIEYDFEKGSLVYFGEINIVGNTKTHDKVIRRELKIREGQLYSGSALRVSRENVERLGFFSPGEVTFNTISPKGKSDVLNVEISVKERSTGTITLGAGYGSAQGFFFTSTVSEINLFGRGQTVSLAGTYSADSSNQSLNLGFTDPYAFDSPYSLGGDLYYILFPITGKYNSRKLGADIRFGVPLSEYTRGFMTYKFESLRITDVQDPSLTADIIAPDNGLLSSVILSVVRDKRNNRFETTDGNYQSVTFETAGLGGDKHFFKWDVNNRFYKKVIGDLVFRNSTEVGQILAWSGYGLPPAEKFYLGGPNNMKGFEFFTLGPYVVSADGRRKVPLGGEFQAFSLFELEHPIIKEAGLKFVAFFDVGNSWGGSGANDSAKLAVRADYGWGIRWFSPIGPLRFEFGYPINPQAFESSSVFQFFIGPPF